MNNIILFFSLIFISFSLPSLSKAEWRKVGETVSGNVIYVDFTKIKNHGGHVYFGY